MYQSICLLCYHNSFIDPAAVQVKAGLVSLDQPGLGPGPGSAAELARYIESEYETWGKAVRPAGIKAQ